VTEIIENIMELAQMEFVIILPLKHAHLDAQMAVALVIQYLLVVIFLIEII
jgi:hypothetical protein